MNRIKGNAKIFATAAAVLLTLGGVTWYTSAVAGEPQKKTAGDSRPTLFEVVRLKKTNAEQVANVLYSLYRSKESNATMRLVPDNATNSIVVRAPADQLREILEAIGKLDVEAPRDASAVEKISVFDLRSVEPDEALQKALRVVFPGNSSDTFAIDRVRKTVVVRADPVKTEAVQALLSRLEDLGTTRPDEDVQVRVIWMIDSERQRKEAKEEIGQTPPSDLKDVLPGLVKLGIHEPRVYAQLVVNAQPNKRFEAKGIVGPEQVSVSVSGRVNNRLQPPGMEITIDARHPPQELCHLQTEISAPSGHFVVLGVTPQDQSRSAFVVQMIRQDEKKRR